MHLASNPGGKKTCPVQKSEKEIPKCWVEDLDREEIELLILTESQDKGEDLFSVPLYSCCCVSVFQHFSFYLG